LTPTPKFASFWGERRGDLMLKIQIPARFKQPLLDRFDLNKVQKNGEWYEIAGHCPLCKEYPVCIGCPFARGNSNEHNTYCTSWIYNFLGKNPLFHLGSDSVFWTSKNNELARKQIQLLLQKAEELIEWT